MVTETIRKCRICKAEEFKPVLGMGNQPLVNSLIDEKDLDKTEPVFPLVVEQCQVCGLVQVVNPLDTHSIYTKQDYLYYSGEMPGLKEYFEEYARDLEDRFLLPTDFVVEIGSNDGLMLDMFHSQKLGVDPSTNVAIRAIANGIPTVSDGFSEKVAKNIKQEFGSANLIYGNNCIAHIDDLHDVMRGVTELLTDDGVFVVECNYWGGMVKNKNYSLVYHDHFSYFTVLDWLHIGTEHGLKPFDAIVTSAQGGSLRIFLSKDNRDSTERLVELVAQEEKTNLKDYSTCQKYNKECNEEAKALRDKIRALKAEGKTIAGYGAAAKGFSILSLAGIVNEIDFFVDDSPAKQGKYTPVNHVPVVRREDRPDPDVFIITAPNYADIIKVKEVDFKGQWITP